MNRSILNIWAVGVGAVIGGDFFGWNPTLEAGYGGALLALFLGTVVYVLLVMTVAELSSRFPKAGGAHVYVLECVGPGAAYVTGVAEVLKTVSVTAAAVDAIAEYLTGSLGISNSALGQNIDVFIWFFALFVLTVINCIGIKATFGFQISVLLLSISVLFIFYVGAIPFVNFSEYAVPHGWFPNGIKGFMKGLPFVLWMLLGVEEVPQAVEHVDNPSRDIPAGAGLALVTLFILGLATITLSAAAPPGTEALIHSEAPLLTSYKAIYGPDSHMVSVISFLAMSGLIASLHSFVYFSGQVVYGLSRDSFLPAGLAKVHDTFGTPCIAFVLSGTLCFAMPLFFKIILGPTDCVNVLVGVALESGMISYFLQMIAYIRLKSCGKSCPEISDVYESPFGVWGAYITTFFLLFIYGGVVYLAISNFDHLLGMLFVGTLLLLSVVHYILVVSRKESKLQYFSLANNIE
uniref:Amino acid permease/ SLC12A domain-containing protein n=1 Tax=Fibrocapsa japonica TaxID=94617 RepID=A0A7S2UWC9_9STRA|mmetsp:Transcript_16752/g.24608  ORF Transcript_16752/g.24608 Transcript_16752/m.24608 type:complete len:462 (+) Transcript_16752:105-1490(+)